MERLTLCHRSACVRVCVRVCACARARMIVKLSLYFTLLIGRLKTCRALDVYSSIRHV